MQNITHTKIREIRRQKILSAQADLAYMFSKHLADEDERRKEDVEYYCSVHLPPESHISSVMTSTMGPVFEDEDDDIFGISPRREESEALKSFKMAHQRYHVLESPQETIEFTVPASVLTLFGRDILTIALITSALSFALFGFVSLSLITALISFPVFLGPRKEEGPRLPTVIKTPGEEDKIYVPAGWRVKDPDQALKTSMSDYIVNEEPTTGGFRI